MALGTVSVSPLELAAAYTAFANLGVGSRPRLVVKVERANGAVLWQAPGPEHRQVLAPGVAYLVTDALREALRRGTGSAVSQSGFRAPAAGKTGTTNDGADAWFVGYTPRMLAAVWIGFDRRQPIMAKATGGRLAAPVWARIMKRVIDSRSSATDWPRPADVIEEWTDPSSGMLLAAGCRPLEGSARRELFVRTTVPVPVCPNQGEPLMIDASQIEPPDYEEGLETGLPAAAAPAAAPQPTTEMQSYVPSTPRPRAVISPEPALSPPPLPLPDDEPPVRPTPTPSPSPP
jgi:penicillin-binding protein 1A